MSLRNSLLTLRRLALALVTMVAVISAIGAVSNGTSTAASAITGRGLSTDNRPSTGTFLTVAGITVNNKVYDGTTAVTLNTANAVLVGATAGDNVFLNTANTTGSFFSKLVGNGKTVTISGLTLTGNDAAKYTLLQPSAVADVAPAVLNVISITAKNKVYDGNTAAALNTADATLSGLVQGDTVALNTTFAKGTFSDSNAGNSRAVTVSGLSISGVDALNYTLLQPTATADITPKPLLIVAENKTMVPGTALPSLTAQATGLVGTDTIDALRLGYTLSTTATITSPIGSYVISLSGGIKGTTNYNPVTYINGLLSITQATTTTNTTTAIKSSANPSATGASIVFTATVTSGAGTPGGSVQFRIDNSDFGRPVSLSGGTATSGAVSNLSSGYHNVSAVYGGDINFSVSVGELSQVVATESVIVGGGGGVLPSPPAAGTSGPETAPSPAPINWLLIVGGIFAAAIVLAILVALRRLRLPMRSAPVAGSFSRGLAPSEVSQKTEWGTEYITDIRQGQLNEFAADAEPLASNPVMSRNQAIEQVETTSLAELCHAPPDDVDMNLLVRWGIPCDQAEEILRQWRDCHKEGAHDKCQLFQLLGDHLSTSRIPWKTAHAMLKLGLGAKEFNSEDILQKLQVK